MKFFYIINLLVFTQLNLFAQLNDIVISVEKISDTCNYGKNIIFRDTDKDNIYDKIRRVNCDFSFKENLLLIKGSRTLLSGLVGKVLNGDFFSNYFIIEIKDPFKDEIWGYLTLESISDTVILEFINTNISELKNNFFYFFPNPFTSFLNLEIKTFTEDLISISIVNQFGSIIRTKEMYKINNGTNSISLNTENLPSGMYFLKINYGKNIYLQKIIKL